MKSSIPELHLALLDAEVDELLLNKADVEIRNHNGETPLMAVCTMKYADRVCEDIILVVIELILMPKFNSFTHSTVLQVATDEAGNF